MSGRDQADTAALVSERTLLTGHARLLMAHRGLPEAPLAPTVGQVLDLLIRPDWRTIR